MEKYIGRWRGIIITGVSGGGKSTLTDLLCKRVPSFEQVKAVTTRAPRPNDEPGFYVHLSEGEFEEGRDSLIIWAEYRGKFYGITRGHIADVMNKGKMPIMVITPKSLAEFLERSGCDGDQYLSVFIDAPDDVLDDRLNLRQDADHLAAVIRQRAEDRSHQTSCDHVLQNVDLKASLVQILGWWSAAANEVDWRSPTS